MLAKPLLKHILDDDSLTRGLGDAEARILVEWLVEQAESVADLSICESAAHQQVRILCRRGRAIGRFVGLWCHSRARGAAGQLAAAERFAWPFPSPAADACEIMTTILRYETDQLSTSNRDAISLQRSNTQ
jgi:hypothetical protein